MKISMNQYIPECMFTNTQAGKICMGASIFSIKCTEVSSQAMFGSKILGYEGQNRLAFLTNFPHGLW